MSKTETKKNRMVKVMSDICLFDQSRPVEERGQIVKSGQQVELTELEFKEFSKPLEQHFSFSGERYGASGSERIVITRVLPVHQ